MPPPMTMSELPPLLAPQPANTGDPSLLEPGGPGSAERELAEALTGDPVSPVSADLVENLDGSVDVPLPEDGVNLLDGSAFDANLAELLDDGFLGELANEYLDLVENDIKTREKRDEQYAEGIKRTGLGKEAPGGADFDGASKAVHPMLTKGCVDFASRAIKELFPATGPCKTQIIGEQTDAKLDKAERKKTYMNWQATTQVAENRAELERLLSQVPLAGAAYKRWWYDPELKRNRTEAVFVDDVFTPYGASDFYTSPRVTHRQRVFRAEYDRRVRTGLYRDLELTDDAFLAAGDESRSQAASDKVEGAEPDALLYNEDGLRVIYQIEASLDLLEDPLVERAAPYIIHLDAASHEVLGIYRNWAEDDETLQKKHWMSEWPFIPWRGGPAVGLAHIIGSLSGATTGALRALLDSAHIQNFPGGLKLRGGRSSGETKTVSPTELQEIDAPAADTSPDIRKLVMPFPFAGPSQVLFNLMEWLTQQGEQVISVASEALSNVGPNAPVGTTMALIEHESANFSAIHARLHNAMKHDLSIMHRLNKEHLTDEEVVEELGELVVKRADFEGPIDVIPVSDPNIFSETQRFSQLQALLQLKSDPAFQPFFKPEQLLARALKLLQVNDPDSITALPKEAKDLTPVEENYAVSSGDQRRPLKVYEHQDDLAHLKVHIVFATSPMLGAHPLIASGIMPALLQHCKEHLLALYRKHALAATEALRTVLQGQGEVDPEQLKPEELQLQGQAFAEKLMAEFLEPLVLPGLAKMQEIVTQIMQSQAPKPSPDIALAQETFKQVELAKIASKEKQVQADLQDEAAARQDQAQLAQLATQVQMLLQQQKEGSDQLKLEFKAQQETSLIVLGSILEQAFAGSADTVDEEGNVVPGQSPQIAQAMLMPLMGALEQRLAETIQAPGGSLMQAITGLAQQQQNFEQILQGQQQSTQQTFAQLAQMLQTLMPQQPQATQQPPPGQPQLPAPQ